MFKKSALVLVTTKFINAALRFIRVVIVARILLPEDFGIAATFWITTGMLLALTEFGIEKIIIQDNDGDKEYFGSVAQLLIVLRGIFIASIILIFSYDIALFFDVPEAVNEFRLLALLPLMKGFEHRDIVRKQRTMDFRPLAITLIIPEFVVMLMAYPFATYFADYSAFVYLAILSGLFRLIISHKLAERPFKLAYDNAVLIKVFKFGWPLTVNGFLMLLTLEGDKLIISQYYSKTELGFFAVAFGFATFLPNNIGSILTQIFLPYFSRIRDNSELLFEKLSDFYSLLIWLSVPLVMIMILHGGGFTHLVYGDAYLAASELVKVITIVFFIRLIRQLPNTMAIVYSKTWMVMLSNSVRQLSLLVALVLAISGTELVWLAVSAIAGEIMAFMTIVFFHYKKHDHSAMFWIKPFIKFGTFILVCMALVLNFNEYEYRVSFIIISLMVLVLSLFFVFRYANKIDAFGD